MTALGQGWIYVMDMKVLDYKLKKVNVPGCVVGEDIIFSGDNKTWYMTCMGSGNIIVGDVETDAIKSTISLPKPYPHGIAISDAIDRILSPIPSSTISRIPAKPSPPSRRAPELR